MRTTAYGERDYNFGQTMLTLRTAIGLTQVELANHLGVSRRAVGEWEAGGSYPKTEHLKKFIALAVKSHAFRAGDVAEEIRQFWKVAHQKVLIDECWLSTLLDQRTISPRLHLVPPLPAEAQDDQDLAAADESSRSPTGQGLRKSKPMWSPTGPGLQKVEPSQSLMGQDLGQAEPVWSLAGQGRATGPVVDWGDALAVPVFYGREEELAQLTQWVVQEHCHMVGILGMGGIGKSALSVSIMYRLAEGTATSPCPFEIVLFRSLRDAPSCEALLDDCLQVISPQSVVQNREEPSGLSGQMQGRTGTGQDPRPASTLLERRISLLLSLLRMHRVLLVLDNLEGLLQAGDVRGRFRPGFEGYGQLLRRVAETEHQSCLLFTSREKPADLRSLEGKRSSVRSLRLGGLGVAACKQLLVEKDLVGSEVEQEHLIESYGGNPLALKIVAETIADLFGGEIGAFFAEEIGIFGSITELLNEQFGRLSVLERSVFFWLAIAREPMNLDELLALLVGGVTLPVGQSPLVGKGTPAAQGIPAAQGTQSTAGLRVQVLEAIDAGYRRSLIERGKVAGCFTLQSVVLEYVTGVLVAEGSREIEQHQLSRLIWHGLSQGHAKEYVRLAQERLLLLPLLARLQSAGGRGQAQILRGRDSAEGRLLDLLEGLRSLPDGAQGYGPANLIALLRLLRGNLNGLDLSKLCIRGTYLRGIEMQGASLAYTQVQDTVFTEAVSATWGVAISGDGMLWAASGMQGKVRVWGEGGRTLLLIWQAHADLVQSLAFSPDGRMLASGSVDGTVKLWDVEACGALLWVGWHNCPQMLAFSPDGRLLVSSGLGETVRVWDAASGTLLQSLVHPAHVFTVAWSPDGGLLVSSCLDGQLRLWEGPQTWPLHGTEILRLLGSWETGPLGSIAFAPDGRTLASAGWRDRKVKLWDMQTLRNSALGLSEGGPCGLLYTFEGETTSRRGRVAWSPDGRTLASCSYGKTIRIFDVEQRRQRATLSGHISDVNRMAFTPDSSHLLSSSNDGTLRVWDVASGHCVSVIHGYAVSYYGLDWSPDSRCLVSGGTDGVVSIWDVSGEKPPIDLRGHSWLVWGVGWSPDGSLVASCGWDTVICLWNPTTRTRVQVFEESSTTLAGIAWSPDGKLLAVGTFLQGLSVWDVREKRHRWVAEADRTAFISVAWSPDGSLLAGGCDDGSVYLWESTDGRRLKRLLGHHGIVNCLAWSPDGKWLASGSGNRGQGELFVWDVEAWRRSDQTETNTVPSDGSARCSPTRVLMAHSDMVYALAWSSRDAEPCACSEQDATSLCSCNPSSGQLISGGGDGRLCWWDVQRGECVRTQEAHHGLIRSIRVSRDGTRLASCGDDGTIRVWNLTSHEHIMTLRRDRPYERMDITGIRGLTEAQKATLQTLGAIETDTVP